MGKQVAAGSHGGLAQLGEHLPCKQGVESSNLLVSTSGEKAAERTLKTEYRETKIQSKKSVVTAGAVARERIRVTALR